MKVEAGKAQVNLVNKIYKLINTLKSLIGCGYYYNIDNNADIRWYKNSKLHREDGPAIELYNGHKEWWLNDKRHRINGHAVEYTNGQKSWFINGKLHRQDGPAMEYANGDKIWYKNGLLHREDGPAVERIDGTKMWFVNGILISDFKMLFESATLVREEVKWLKVF